jgi:hypothetical protein
MVVVWGGGGSQKEDACTKEKSRKAVRSTGQRFGHIFESSGRSDSSTLKFRRSLSSTRGWSRPDEEENAVVIG